MKEITQDILKDIYKERLTDVRKRPLFFLRSKLIK